MVARGRIELPTQGFSVRYTSENWSISMQVSATQYNTFIILINKL